MERFGSRPRGHSLVDWFVVGAAAEGGLADTRVAEDNAYHLPDGGVGARVWVRLFWPCWLWVYGSGFGRMPVGLDAQAGARSDSGVSQQFRLVTARFRCEGGPESPNSQLRVKAKSPTLI